MVTSQDLSELRQWVAAMASLEDQIEDALDQGQKLVRDYPEASDAFKRFHSIVGEQREALRMRLSSMGGSEPGASGSIAPYDAAGLLPKAEGPYPVSRTLHIICTAFHHAAFGYATLHTVAHRYNQRSGQDNTAGMAEEYQRSCIAAAQDIHRLIPDVVISEMGKDKECRCTCPSCGLGICLCWHSHVDSLMPVSPAEEGGILVRLPRANSAAAKAGLQQGDVILAVDGQNVQSYQDLLAELRKCSPGDSVQLQVLSEPGDLREIAITLR